MQSPPHSGDRAALGSRIICPVSQKAMWQDAQADNVTVQSIPVPQTKGTLHGAEVEQKGPLTARKDSTNPQIQGSTSPALGYETVI